MGSDLQPIDWSMLQDDVVMLVHDLVEERLLLDVIIKDDLHLRLMRLHLLLSPLYRWHSIHSILG